MCVYRGLQEEGESLAKDLSVNYVGLEEGYLDLVALVNLGIHTRKEVKNPTLEWCGRLTMGGGHVGMGCWRVEDFPNILEGSHSTNPLFND
jgi:hypothetical protein